MHDDAIEYRDDICRPTQVPFKLLFVQEPLRLPGQETEVRIEEPADLLQAVVVIDRKEEVGRWSRLKSDRKVVGSVKTRKIR